MAGRAQWSEAVSALLEQGRIGDAARQCAAEGEHAQASALHEQACEFREAAAEAQRAGDPARALRLAILAGDAALKHEARARLCAERGAPHASRVAADLAARGQDVEAARLWAVAGEPLTAAQAFERAGAALEAGQAYELAGKPADAARVLEAALRSPLSAPTLESGADATDALRLTLGRLYAGHGRDEAAVRQLQRIEASSAARADALTILATCLARLGLDQARRDVEAELATHARAMTSGPALGASGPAEATTSAEPAVQPHAHAPHASGPNGAASVRLFGRYVVAREVVTTPHARLLEAVDELTGERVAVKMFAAELAGAGRDAWLRFAREAEVLRQLRHPSVVELREFVPSGPALVMAWMAGGSLRELIDREPLAPARAAEIASHVLSALGEAHRRGILHRDVKPSNVLFDEAGAPRLGDFGAAHLGSAGATVTAAAIGTAAYMAPEQRRGEPATAASDVFGVGMLLCEMLHGSLPSGALIPSQWHPDLGAEHDTLVGRLVATEPTARFADAVSALQAMAAIAWPTRRVARARPIAEQPTDRAESHRAARRLRRANDEPESSQEGRWRDTWLGRDVLVVPDEPAARELACAFARADHPALPMVLRVDSATGQIWVEAPHGVPLVRTGGRLPRAQHATLLDALRSLHAAGGRHGAVDEHHVFVDRGAVTLAWPSGARGRPDEADELAALARLTTG